MQRLVIEPDQVAGSQIKLTTAQQHYLHQVLRLTAGQKFIALDGAGQQWLAELTAESGWARLVETLASADNSGSPRLTLVMALPKGNGFDEVVRQATELGVDVIQPVISDRTLLRPSLQKLERWQRIAAEATEQSERLTLPLILPPQSWEDYLAGPLTAARYLAVARQGSVHLLTDLQQGVAPSITVAVGPEGGWTEPEVVAALAQGFQPITLGTTILRAVTAPLVALAVIRAMIDST